MNEDLKTRIRTAIAEDDSEVAFCAASDEHGAELSEAGIDTLASIAAAVVDNEYPGGYIEALRVVADTAALCMIDLGANLKSAYDEWMRGDLPRGAYEYVLQRHGSMLLALRAAGYTCNQPVFDFPIRPDDPRLRDQKPPVPAVTTSACAQCGEGVVWAQQPDGAAVALDVETPVWIDTGQRTADGQPRVTTAPTLYAQHLHEGDAPSD